MSSMPEYLRSIPVVTSAYASKGPPLLLPLPPPLLDLLLVEARVRSSKATPRWTAVWSEWPETPPSSNVKICADQHQPEHQKKRHDACSGQRVQWRVRTSPDWRAEGPKCTQRSICMRGNSHQTQAHTSSTRPCGMKSNRWHNHRLESSFAAQSNHVRTTACGFVELVHGKTYQSRRSVSRIYPLVRGIHPRPQPKSGCTIKNTALTVWIPNLRTKSSTWDATASAGQGSLLPSWSKGCSTTTTSSCQNKSEARRCSSSRGQGRRKRRRWERVFAWIPRSNACRATAFKGAWRRDKQINT